MKWPVEFKYQLTGTGWSEAHFAIDQKSVTVTASYLSDALGDLLRALGDLVNGAESASASWAEEPGEYRWIFVREHRNAYVRIIGYDEWRSGAADEESEPLLEAHCDLTTLVSAIAQGAREVLEEHGEDGYMTKWVEHPFPKTELEILERWLRTGN